MTIYYAIKYQILIKNHISKVVVGQIDLNTLKHVFMVLKMRWHPGSSILERFD